MKRLIIMLLTMAAFVPRMAAQTPNPAEQDFEFIYIAHDRTTPVGRICEVIEDRYQRAYYNKDVAVIFYLANRNSPIVVRLNVDNDNRKDYPRLVNALQTQLEHDIDPMSDIRNIADIFDETDFLTDEETPRFKSFTMTWYVTPIFWELGYNKDVILGTHVVLDFDSLPGRYFTEDVYFPENSKFKYDEAKPFGDRYKMRYVNILPL